MASEKKTAVAADSSAGILIQTAEIVASYVEIYPWRRSPKPWYLWLTTYSKWMKMINAVNGCMRWLKRLIASKLSSD